MSVESPPFARGQTYYNGNTIDSADYGGIPYEGRTFIWETDSLISSTTINADTQRRSSNRARTIIVRNVSTIALAPGRIVTWQTGQWGKRVDGYSAVAPAAGTLLTGAIAGVVDDRINGTVAVGDLFHLVVAGPCNVVQAASNLAVDVSQGDVIVAITAAATTSATAGKFTRQNVTFAAADTTDGTALAVLKNNLGRAMTTSLTNATNANVLVWLDLPWVM